MTAQTATASRVHHPFGSPSGPGLFRVKGLQLPAYIQNVAHALQRSGSAKDESTAIQMAVGVIRRWAAGDAGHGKRVHPDVQAAASRALAEWEAAKAAAHSHSNRDGDAVDLSSDLGEALAASWLDLARVAPGGGGGTKTAAPATKGLPTAAQVNIATGATGPRAKPAGAGKQSGSGGGSSGSLHPHVAAGSPAGGQFAKKGSGSSSSASPGKAAAAKKAAPKKATAKGTAAKAPAAKAPAGKATPPKAAAKAPAKAKQPGKATAPKKAGKPLPKAGSRQQALQQRAGLLKQAAGDRAKVKAVNARIASLTTAIHAAVKAAAAQKAAAANKKSATATAATAVKAAATAPAASTTTAAGATKTTTASTTAAKATATVAQMRATRSTLRARVVSLKAHAAGLEKQAAAIKLSSGEDDGSGRFLEMAFAEALTERVPPGKAEGGQFHARTSLTRHDTPEEAARAVNAMGEAQRAVVRARILPPPGFEWARGDRLAQAH